MATEFTLNTGKPHPGGMSRNSVTMITDRPDMHLAVYRGCKEKNQNLNLFDSPFLNCPFLIKPVCAKYWPIFFILFQFIKSKQ